MLLSYRAAAVSLFAAVTVAGGTASAASSPGAVVEIQLPMLGYTHDSVTTTPDEGDALDVTTGDVATAPFDDAELAILWSKLALRVNPFRDEKRIAAGFLVMPALEVGGELVFTSHSVDKPTESSASTKVLGAYGLYTLKRKKLGVEAGGDLHYASVTSETTVKGDDADTTTKSDASGFGLSVGGKVLLPLRKNLSYAGGLALSYDSNTDSEAKTKTSSVAIRLTLAEIRVTID